MAEESKNTSGQNEDPGAQNTGAGGSEPEKKYTDDEVNGIVAKKTSKAVDKFLKDLGITEYKILSIEDKGETIVDLRALEMLKWNWNIRICKMVTV